MRVDWGVRGLWESQREALFDICICNADAPSYQGKSIDSVFNEHKDFKRKKYAEAAEHKRASFSPILATCDGVFDFEAKAYTRQLAVLLSKKWSKSYAEVHGWIKARMQICIIRSVSLCLRGSRTKWRGAECEDGAALPMMSEV